MAVGKYSPTVQHAYTRDQNWWDKLPKSDEVGLYDVDGYDSYGYNRDDVDRAGNKEYAYMYGETIGDDYEYVLYNRVLDEWTFDGQRPVEVKR